MKNRAAQNRREARAKIAALARTALSVCDEIARLGREDDDRPRMWLLAVDRWGMGAEVPELAALTRAMTQWMETRAVLALRHPLSTWGTVLFRLDDARKDVAKHVTHVDDHEDRVTFACERVLVELAGETMGAAHARVKACHWQHLCDITRGHADLARQDRREQAKRDREVMERRLAEPARGSVTR